MKSARLAFVAVAILSSTSGAKPQKPLLHYFTGVQLQFESATQCREIKRALGAMLAHSKLDLQTKLYQNYQGKPGQWTLLDLLHGYFVPTDAHLFPDEQAVIDGYRSEPVKTEIRKIIKKYLSDCESVGGE